MGVEKTCLNLIFFPACFLLNVALYEEAHFMKKHISPIQGVFLKKFYAHIAALENISMH